MEYIADLQLFLVSVVLISVPWVVTPGPVFAVTVANGYKNKKAGILTAIGHGVIEFPLIFLLYFGLSNFLNVPIVNNVIGLVGGVILVYMGFQMFKTRDENEVPQNSKHSSFVAGVITTGANPYFFISWATIGAALVTNATIFGFLGILLFAVTHWSIDLIWNIFVSVTVFKSRSFWTPRIFKAVSIFCSAVLISFGLWFIISVFL